MIYKQITNLDSKKKKKKPFPEKHDRIISVRYINKFDNNPGFKKRAKLTHDLITFVFNT